MVVIAIRSKTRVPLNFVKIWLRVVCWMIRTCYPSKISLQSADSFHFVRTFNACRYLCNKNGYLPLVLQYVFIRLH